MTVQSLIMALSPGTRLGHSDVTALIGEGGMGEVWQTTDTTLNRQVALKILPEYDSSRFCRKQLFYLMPLLVADGRHTR